MMERMGTGMGTQGMPTPTMPGGMPSSMNWMMVPRCTFKMEKVTGGMKMTCTCDDPMSVSMMQHLCSAMMGSMCSCCMMMNGMMVCCCNLTMGMCKCEMMDKGMVVTCTSGDKACMEMIQSCCDCMNTMLKAGCTCCMMMNNTPVCCGCC
jgi:hypothetical protein